MQCDAVVPCRAGRACDVAGRRNGSEKEDVGRAEAGARSIITGRHAVGVGTEMEKGHMARGGYRGYPARIKLHPKVE